MIERLRPVVSAVLALYAVSLSIFLLTTGEQGGESGVEWLYLLPVLTAAVMGLFLAVRRPENAIGTLISLTGAALVTLGTQTFNRSRYDAHRVIGSFTETLQEQVDPDEVVKGWVEVIRGSMQPAAVGYWVRDE